MLKTFYIQQIVDDGRQANAGANWNDTDNEIPNGDVYACAFFDDIYEQKN